MEKIRAVLLDMIGTTVIEKDRTVITSCFENAFSQHSIAVDRTQISSVRGMDKMAAIELLLKRSNSPLELRPKIFESFKSAVQKNITNFEEHPELEVLINQLRDRKIVVGVASGLPQVLFEMLFEKFNWKRYSLDYTNVYENFPLGRPDPAMIFDMCQKFKIKPDQLLKVGDTVSDIEEGKNAGSITAAVLVGTQADSALRNSTPDFVLSSLSDIINVLN